MSVAGTVPMNAGEIVTMSAGGKIPMSASERALMSTRGERAPTGNVKRTPKDKMNRALVEGTEVLVDMVDICLGVDLALAVQHPNDFTSMMMRIGWTGTTMIMMIRV